jgi:serine protease AprX
VLNMSFGVALDMPSRLNPLDRAVKVAWNAGIVVVVSAGNDGPGNGTILSPGDAPEVITVGALDDNGTVVSADDTMTEFSSVGPTKVDGWFKPDLVASGRSVVSVRAANSTIDLLYPGARIDTAYFAGSGSSFSSAITAGAAALVIGALPRVTPDVVKARLLATAAPGPVGNPFVDGHGALDVYTAATTAAIKLAQPPSLSAIAPGGSVSLLTTWEQSSWNPAMWSSGLWTGPSWTGSNWAGSSWNGSSWNGSSWNGAAWVGSNWAGSNWAGSNWAGSSWNGSNWAGSNWAGSSWGDAAPG